MKILHLLELIKLFGICHAQVARDHNKYDYYVLHIDDSTTPGQVADRLSLRHEGQLGNLDGHHVFRSVLSDNDFVDAKITEWKMRKRSMGGSDPLDGVLLSAKQKRRRHLEKRMPPPIQGPYIYRRQSTADLAVQRRTQIMTALNITDPTFTRQWHLFNPNNTGQDLNVTGVWLDGITGRNSTVAIVDDGLDMNSTDLAANYFAAGSWDFNDADSTPAPVFSDDTHGTRCAGEVAAGRNDACGLGVAYDSKVSGIRILSGAITDADEAEALNFKPQDNDIYSCSWGPTDDGATLDGPGTLARRALVQGVEQGRGGLGSIYVFASGNGAAAGDNCNFDGYANSIYTIAIGAIDNTGALPSYSEHCSALVAVTHSSGGGNAIHTTNVGTNACTSTHGGTSAAAPLAAGAFALALQVRPDLSWRDMQYLAIDTSVPINDGNSEIQITAIGKVFSHRFGYGKIDTYALVQKARTWTTVKPQVSLLSPLNTVNTAIPQGATGVNASFQVTQDMLTAANLARLEHVTVNMTINHARRGDLSVDLISPQNVASRLAVTRRPDTSANGFKGWRFMSVAHWGESGVGNWTVVVRDTVENEFNGTFVGFSLRLWGEAINA